MTAKDRVRKYIFEFPEISRNTFLGIVLSFLTVGFSMIMKFQCKSQSNQEVIAAKLDSTSVKVDSTAKPRHQLVANMDTIKSLLRKQQLDFNQLYFDVHQHLEMSAILVPEIKDRLAEDSAKFQTLFAIINSKI